MSFVSAWITETVLEVAHRAMVAELWRKIPGWVAPYRK